MILWEWLMLHNIDVCKGYFSTTAKRKHMKFGVSIIIIAPTAGGSTYLGIFGSFSFQNGIGAC